MGPVQPHSLRNVNMNIALQCFSYTKDVLLVLSNAKTLQLGGTIYGDGLQLEECSPTQQPLQQQVTGLSAAVQQLCDLLQIRG